MTYVFMYLIMINFIKTALSNLKIQNFLLLIMVLAILSMAGKYQICLYENFNVNLRRVLETDYIQGKRLLNTHIPHRKFVWSNDRLDQQNVFYWRARLRK